MPTGVIQRHPALFNSNRNNSTDYSPYKNNTTGMKSSTGLSNSSNRRRRERPSPSGSTVLTDAENRHLFDILGPDRVSLTAAVVQLLNSDSSKWRKQHTGVVSLVKDYNLKCYVMNMYDVFNGELLWSQTL